MRRAVHKPNIQQPPTIKPRYPVATTESGVTVEAPKHSVHSVDDSRVQRSQKVHKSSHVGRFQATVLAPLRARVIPVSVSEPAAPAAPPQPEAPVPTPAVPPVVQPPAEPTPQPPVAPAPEPQPPVAPAPTPQPPSAPTPYTQPPVQQPYVAPQPQPKASIFERALQSAKSHEQPAHKARKRRVRSISAGIAAFVVLGGFVALLNQSTVSLQLASVRAGFQASAPSYTPNGFKQGGASVQGKSVSINYVSAEDGSATYTLTQESSNWDSQTLFDSIVTSPDVKYQLIQNNGRNIYVYGKSKAAWVDGGVLYRISGTAELDGNEIVSIASSL